ncbi:hypothetical protein MLD38_013173 [Melastoma candidum]|uniref:Uncharacterized protein n=1 Tax=Melastoma candidum TaxID=119954 RepID=A0ACB9R843_9MYRT|nr:hypothetical protein MLD38_013173 [Melastoma candidum]
MKHNKSKKGRRRQRKTTPPVRRLFRTCLEVFADGGVPAPADVERLRAVLDDLQPEDVGLTADMPYFRKMMVDGPQTISYLHLHECDKFSIGIFCFPPSGIIPLHNHPGMTVFSKLLFGTMHIKSYDWVADDRSRTSVDSTPLHPSGARLAEVQVDAEFSAPCETFILYPAEGGNMHRFTGVTACAVLDVLGPPYSDAEGRHCTYFRDFPLKSVSGPTAQSDGVSVPEEEEKGRFAWLGEMEKPADFAVVGEMYRGPRLTT